MYGVRRRFSPFRSTEWLNQIELLLNFRHVPRAKRPPKHRSVSPFPSPHFAHTPKEHPHDNLIPNQWRCKAVRGPGLAVTWVSPLSSFTSPHPISVDPFKSSYRRSRRALSSSSWNRNNFDSRRESTQHARFAYEIEFMSANSNEFSRSAYVTKTFMTTQY